MRATETSCQLLRAALLACALAGAGLAAVTPAAAQVQDARTGATLTVPVNKSRTLRVPRPYAKAAVGNAKIADVMPVSNTAVYLLGKDLGATNLSLYDRAGNLIAVVDVNVTPDAGGLKQKLAEVLPTEAVGVQVSNDSVILSGTVASAAAAARAATIAETYAPKKVINMLSVGTAQQILLEVRFAEMQRGTVKQLGLSTVSYSNSGSSGLITAPAQSITASGVYSGSFNIPGIGLSFRLDALEQQGLIRTLAQPNLIALSGETANFLAGGEFPVPTGVALNGQVSIEFKQFGVGLAFSPTLLEDGLINMVVAPEVSQLDPAAGIDLAGLRIPGLKVRRARTTLELRDGQTFALAGLIQQDFTSTVNAVPGLGKIPILGALFRSNGFNRRETELVILVTPRIVRPVKAGTKLMLPTDQVEEPDDAAFFLLGKAEKRNKMPVGTMLPLPGPESAINRPGGVTAEHGHIVR